jgi:hypothetical protein
MNLEKMFTNEYQYIIVESFIPSNTAGKHGPIHVRPLPGQEPFRTNMFVECSKDLSQSYPIGTRFRIKAKITSRQGGSLFIYSHYSWFYEVLNTRF